MPDQLDMSMMFAMHDALRRELVQVARTASRRDGNPARRLHATLGWELFKKFLLVHHRSEDDTLWPALRAHAAGAAGWLALVDALEAEHATIDPLLTAIDAAAADPDAGYQRFGDIVDELVTKLTAHLAHEETDGLPLIDASLTPQESQASPRTTPSGSAPTRRCTCPRCSMTPARRLSTRSSASSRRRCWPPSARSGGRSTPLSISGPPLTAGRVARRDSEPDWVSAVVALGRSGARPG
jgi:hypothetical protein